MQDLLSPVDASIQLSYELLTDELKLRFRQLGVFPIPFDKNAIQAVWQIDNKQTDNKIGELLKYSLLNFDKTTSRYWLHDFLRESAFNHLTEQEANDSFLFYSKHYYKILETADDYYDQGGENILKGLLLFDFEWLHISFAQNWASTNMTKLDAAAQLCVYKREPRCLRIKLHYQNQIEWFQYSLQACLLLKDRQGEGFYLGILGNVYFDSGNFPKAIEFQSRHCLPHARSATVKRKRTPSPT